MTSTAACTMQWNHSKHVVSDHAHHGESICGFEASTEVAVGRSTLKSRLSKPVAFLEVAIGRQHLKMQSCASGGRFLKAYSSVKLHSVSKEIPLSTQKRRRSFKAQQISVCAQMQVRFSQLAHSRTRMMAYFCSALGAGRTLLCRSSRARHWDICAVLQLG